MTLFITIFIIVCAVFALAQLVGTLIFIFRCNNNSQRELPGLCKIVPDTYSLWMALGGAIILVGLFAYFCYSMGQLILFHYKMLRTGSLTKEDLGHAQHNFNFTAMYNRFSRAANFAAVRKNQLQNKSLIRGMFAFFGEIEEASKSMTIYEISDKFMYRFVSKEANYFSAVTENLPPEDSEDSSSSEDRYAHIYTPGWDQREAAKVIGISQRANFRIAVIPYLAGLLALRTGRKFIVNTPDEVDAFKKSHPEAFYNRGEVHLLLTGCHGPGRGKAPAYPMREASIVNAIPMREIAVDNYDHYYSASTERDISLENGNGPSTRKESITDQEYLAPQFEGSLSNAVDARVPHVDNSQ